MTQLKTDKSPYRKHRVHRSAKNRRQRKPKEMLAPRLYVKSLGDAKATEGLLNEIAEALSGDLYNFPITFNEARCKVRNLVKSLPS